MSKRSIPFATRREVALRSGANPGGRSDAYCTYCGAVGQIYWPKSYTQDRPGAWVHFRGLELDHVFPEHLGGSSGPDNVTLACRPCNRSKSWKTLAEWAVSHG